MSVSVREDERGKRRGETGPKGEYECCAGRHGGFHARIPPLDDFAETSEDTARLCGRGCLKKPVPTNVGQSMENAGNHSRADSWLQIGPPVF